MWIFMPNWCEGIILLRDGAPGLWYESLGASQSGMSKPRSNAWLHSGVWMLQQYQSEIYYLWKTRRNILLPMNRRFYFWDCLFFYSIRSPVVWLWLWQKADGIPREHQLSSDCPAAISQFCVALSSGVLWLRLFRMMFDGFPSCLVCCVWRDWINQWAWKMCKLKFENRL